VDETVQRTNFEYTLQLQGEIKNRFFYSAGGSVEKNHLYGITGAPRLGLSYDVVRPRHEVVPRHAAARQRRHRRAGAIARRPVRQPLHKIARCR
jgi:hypothetical protein